MRWPSISTSHELAPMSVSGFKFVMFTQPFHHKDTKARRKKNLNRQGAKFAKEMN
jgi:hypothetical protein